MHYIRFTKFIFLVLISFFSQLGVFAQVIPQTFNCTGAPQSFVVPLCVTSVTVEAWGAGGGGGGIDTYTGSPGGGGAYATAVLAVTPGQILTVIVGCGGSQGGACATNGAGGAGGYGYGNGGSGGNSGPSGCSGPGGGGGGGSAVLNGGTPVVVAGGGGGGGGGGNFGDGGNGGGGGQNGFAQSSAGGILGASASSVGLNGASTGADGAGGGGGGGGVNGGGGGQVPGTDYGGSGGAGGTSLGTTTVSASSQTPGNPGSPNLCAGCAVGGNGGSGAPGIPGDIVISYNTPVALTSSIASTNSCVAATATVTPTSGTAGYTYTWSPSGGNAANAGGLTNGLYTVNFTDANGCTGTQTVNITLPTAVTGTASAGPGPCGVSSATVTASGGTPGYTYTWSPSGGNATTANITNGSYTITIKDAMGCIGTATTSVVLPPALTLTALQTNVTCNGLANGSATATASGGTFPYTYAWSPGPPQISTTGIATGLSGGTTYTVGVQDGVGCQDTLSLTITQPAILQQTLTATNPICLGFSSVLNDAVSGGTSPYTVTWSSGGNFIGAAGTTTVSPLITTTYSASVLDAHSCANTATVTVTVNPLPTVTVNSPTICVGGSVTLTANGASTYSWNTGTGLSATVGTSVTANPVTTTVYTITGTDVNTCTSTATSTVTVNPLPTVTVNSATICAGNPTTLTALGATTYTWALGTGLSSTSGNTVTANPASTTVYTITGADANNCINTATSTVVVNALPNVTVNSGTICFGLSMVCLPLGATTYTWGPAAGLSSTTGASVTANPITTTIYTVTGTDANNCSNTATSTVTVNPLPNVTVNTGTICTSGSTTLNANGASTYTWTPATGLSATNGASVSANPTVTTNYTITGTDINNCVNVTTTTVNVNSLPVVTVASATICIGTPTTLTANGAGTYTWSPGTGLSSTFGSTVTANPATTTNYTITGSNGCLSTTTATVTVNSLPTVSVNSATLCAGFTATLTAVGSATTYSWSPATALSATTGISVNANPNTTTIYTLTGTDANSCVNTATSTVVVNPVQIPVAGSNSPICANQNLNFTGTGGLFYVWAGPNGYNTISQNPTIVNSTANQSGTYTLVVTDINNCIDSTTINVTVNPLPIVTASNNSAICANQTLNFSGSGGATYLWTGPNSYSVAAQNPSIANAQVPASVIYTLTATDANNCVSSDTTLVIVNPSPAVTVNSATICIGNSAVLTANGASGTYTWTPSTGLSASLGNPVTANPTTTTSYSVTGIDLTGCSTTIGLTVLVNPLPTVTVNSATICAGSNTTLQAQGANLYSWSPTGGLSSSSGAVVTASPAASATYIVTGTDINNCVNKDTCTVLVNPLPNISITPPTATGCESLCVDFSNTGTSTNGTYFWNFGDSKTSTTVAPSHCFSKGTYTISLQLTDSIGCVNTTTAHVVAYPQPHANFYDNPQPTTILDPVIYFHDITTGGANITSWNWNFGDNLGTATSQNPTHTYQDTGTFAVQLIVTTNMGCKDSITQFVIIEDEYFIYVPNAFTPNFDGTNDIFLPVGEGVTEYKLHVYDRWGQLVFSTNDILQGWDGRHLNKGNTYAQEDTYVWRIEAKNKKGEPKLLKGTVSLIK